MNLNKKIEEYQEFIALDKKTLSNKIEKIAQFISEFHEILYSLKIKYIKLEKQLNEKWTERYLYYKNDYPITLKDSEIKQFIERDVEYNEIKNKLNIYEANIERIELAIKNLDSLRWDIKNYIEWEKFKVGIV